MDRIFTVSLLLQLLALFLTSSVASATVGRGLHAMFGYWNIEDWMGHCLYLGACALLVVNVHSRLNFTLDEIRARFRQRFELPMTVIAPVLLALLMQSPHTDRYWSALTDSPTGCWLNFYWTLLCAFGIYLLGRSVEGLLILRRDPRNRRTAMVYLFACSAGIIVCVVRVVSAWAGEDFSHWYWFVQCAASLAFAEASRSSWRRKVEWFSARDSL